MNRAKRCEDFAGSGQRPPPTVGTGLPFPLSAHRSPSLLNAPRKQAADIATEPPTRVTMRFLPFLEGKFMRGNGSGCRCAMLGFPQTLVPGEAASRPRRSFPRPRRLGTWFLLPKPHFVCPVLGFHVTGALRVTVHGAFSPRDDGRGAPHFILFVCFHYCAVARGHPAAPPGQGLSGLSECTLSHSWRLWS